MKEHRCQVSEECEAEENQEEEDNDDLLVSSDDEIDLLSDEPVFASVFPFFSCYFAYF